MENGLNDILKVPSKVDDVLANNQRGRLMKYTEHIKKVLS